MALPTAFPESDATLGGGQVKAYGTETDVLDLPIYRGAGEIASCWKLSWRERVSALLFARLWLRVISRTTHPPISVQITRTIFKTE